MIKSKLPCGSCDVGIYAVESLINSDAINFLSLSREERIKAIPKCKNRNQKCVGYIDLHKMKIDVDAISETIKRNEKNE